MGLPRFMTFDRFSPLLYNSLRITLISDAQYAPLHEICAFRCHSYVSPLKPSPQTCTRCLVLMYLVSHYTSFVKKKYLHEIIIYFKQVSIRWVHVFAQYVLIRTIFCRDNRPRLSAAGGICLFSDDRGRSSLHETV